MSDSFCSDIVPFDKVWFKDCFHMAFLTITNSILGNADCILMNQFPVYECDSFLRVHVNHINPVSSILSSRGISNISFKKVEDINTVIQNSLHNGFIPIVAVDLYDLSVRKDTYRKVHKGHSVIIHECDFDKDLCQIIEQPFMFSYKYRFYFESISCILNGYDDFIKYSNNDKFFISTIPDICCINGSVPSICLIAAEKKSKQIRDIQSIKQFIEIWEKNWDTIMDSILQIDSFCNIFVKTVNELKERECFIYLQDVVIALNDIILYKRYEEYIFGLYMDIHNSQESNNIIFYYTMIRAMLSKMIIRKRIDNNHIFECARMLRIICEYEKKYYNCVLDKNTSISKTL